MVGVINFFIGIAMAAGAALKGVLESNGGSSFISSLGGELLGASSEFIGDATQGYIGKIVKKIKNDKVKKRMLDSLYHNPNFKEIFSSILRQLGDPNGKSFENKNDKREKQSKRQSKKQDKFNAKLIAKFSMDKLFGSEISDYLCKSTTFNNMEIDDKQAFISIVDTAIFVYNKEMFFNVEEDLQVVAKVIVALLGQEFEVKIEEIKELLSFAANQNGGKFNFGKIVIDKYIPKYILNQCPECGYRGDRLYINEHNSTTYCAACGSSYPIGKYCDPELWKEIKGRLENFSSLLKDLGEGAKNIQTQLESLAKNNKEEFTEITELLQNGLEQVVTQKYLEDILNGKFDEQNKNIEDLLKNAFQEYGNQIGNRMEYLADGQSQVITNNIKSAITEINKNIEEGNIELSNKIVLMNENLLDFRDNTYKKLDEQGTQLKEILEIVKSLEQKGFYNELTKTMEGMKEEFIKETVSKSNNIDEINGNLKSIQGGIFQLLENQVKKIPDNYDKYDEDEKRITCPYCGIKGEIGQRDNRLKFHCNVCENEFLNITPSYIKSKKDVVEKWAKEKGLSKYLADDGKIQSWVKNHTPVISKKDVNASNINDVLILPVGITNDMKVVEINSKFEKIIVSSGVTVFEEQLSNIKILDEMHIYQQKGGIFYEGQKRFNLHKC
ncbi:MAG: hypothetical protein K2L70_08145 [Clostridia bacterium]|nr:hypothetical protein [Clostridia bacterium]